MTEQEIKDQLKKEVEAETPDIWDALRMECSFPEEKAQAEEQPFETEPEKGTEAAKMPEDHPDEESKKTEVIRPRKWRHLYTALVTAAAVLVLVAAGQFLFGRSGAVGAGKTQAGLEESMDGAVASNEVENRLTAMPQETAVPQQTELPSAEPAASETPAAVVDFDVNPSVELQVDEKNRILLAEPLNQDGEKLLETLDLTGSDVTVASYALIGAMLTNGYLTDAANSILISVMADEQEKGLVLEEKLSKDLNLFLENSSISAAVIGQNLEKDEATERFAKEHGISYGKARIIRSLAAAKAGRTEEELLGLSTQQLLLLWTENEKAAGTKTEEKNGSCTIYGEVSTGEYISEEEAVAAALAYAGIADAQNIWTEYDCYGGEIVYEVEFMADGREYEIKIHAATGEVLKVEYEAEEFDDDDRNDPEDAYDTDDDNYSDDDYDTDDDDDSDDDRNDVNDDYDTDDMYDSDDDSYETDDYEEYDDSDDDSDDDDDD